MPGSIYDWLNPYIEKYNFKVHCFAGGGGKASTEFMLKIKELKELKECEDIRIIFLKFKLIERITEFDEIIKKHFNKYYCLNTEQLTIKKRYEKCFELYKNVLDYSEENIDLFKNKSNSICLHLPYLLNRNEIRFGKKIGDIASIYFNGRNRTDCPQMRRSMGIKLKEKFGGKYTDIIGWGKTRDKVLFNHKILINIHAYSSYRINEQIRVNRCVFNKMIVISEPGYNDDLLYLKKYIIMCEYDKIPEKAEEVLNNYEKYYNELFKDFDLDEIEKHYKTIADETIKKIDNN